MPLENLTHKFKKTDFKFVLDISRIDKINFYNP